MAESRLVNRLLDDCAGRHVVLLHDHQERYRQATIVSEHASIEAAYAELGRVAEKLARDGNKATRLSCVS